MCLTNASKVKIARKDIKCYKVALETEPNVFQGPYYGSKYIVDNSVQTVPHFETKADYFIVYYGFHSFRTKKSALKEISYWNNRFTSRGDDDIATVIECIIPKGTQYFRGIFAPDIDALKCFASEKLIFTTNIFISK